MQPANLEFRDNIFRKIKSLNFLYEINCTGTILRNVKSKKQLKIRLNMHHSKTGYFVSSCTFKGKTKQLMIHQLVAECFIGERPEGYEIDHIDRNTHNNYFRNLRYVTHSENMKNRVLGEHVIRQGTKNCAKHVEDISVTTLVNGIECKSMAQAARVLGEVLGISPEKIRAKMKKRRKNIYGFDVIYLNAETGHAHSTE